MIYPDSEYGCAVLALAGFVVGAVVILGGLVLLVAGPTGLLVFVAGLPVVVASTLIAGDPRRRR